MLMPTFLAALSPMTMIKGGRNHFTISYDICINYNVSFSFLSVISDPQVLVVAATFLKV